MTGIGNAAEISGITFRVARGPKVYDSGTDAVTILAPTTGGVPLGCRIVEIFNERLIFGGDSENQGVWYMSRFRDPLDYDYGASATDRARACASNSSNSDAGGLAIPLSAIAALTEDYTLFSAESELYLLRGDPGVGGILGNISRQVGVGSRTAWCRIPDGKVVFLSRDGLYWFHPSRPLPENMSRDKLPAELVDVVQNTDLTVTLEYDVRFRGIHICVTPSTARPTAHYWFDLETQSFWVQEFGTSEHEPFSITYDAKANRVLLGCRDGYIRHYDNGAADDDGTVVTKQVDYGPIPLNRGLAAVAESLQITLDDGSDDVSWTFRTGLSAEEAYNAIPRAAGTASAGFNRMQSVRHYGHYGFLRLSTTAADRWAVNSIKLRVLTTPVEGRRI